MNKSAFLAIMLLIGSPLTGPSHVVAAQQPAAVRVFVRCSPMLKPGVALPTGSKLFGRLPSVGAPLYEASMINDAPATVDPMKGLDDLEIDEGGGGKTITTSFATDDPRPLSVACRYGAKKTPPFAQAILFIPIPDRVRGQCRFDNAHFPHTMVCTGR